jgi:hypothetical protein
MKRIRLGIRDRDPIRPPVFTDSVKNAVVKVQNVIITKESLL